MAKQSTRTVEQGTQVALFRCMFTARKIEERLVKLYHQGRIWGGVYTGVGQEAIGAATALAAGPQDVFAPLIRDLTVHLTRGETPLQVFRQFLGRADGPTRGRDGNVHYGNLDHGVYPMISHLCAMLAVLDGAVMARRRRGEDTVGWGYCGDGATSTGDFHEAVNFAAVFDLPVVFVIENNQYAYSTPTALQYRCKKLADRAIGYGIDGWTVDGNDALGLYQFAAKIREDLRVRPRPILLECETMRMRGHGEHDDCAYVDPALLNLYAKRDPIDRLRQVLLKEGVTETALAAVERQCQADVEQACLQALSDPPPDPTTLREGVYAPG